MLGKTAGFVAKWAVQMSKCMDETEAMADNELLKAYQASSLAVEMHIRNLAWKVPNGEAEKYVKQEDLRTKASLAFERRLYSALTEAADNGRKFALGRLSKLYTEFLLAHKEAGTFAAAGLSRGESLAIDDS